MRYLFLSIVLFSFKACYQEFGEGYSFKLFKKTVNEKLIKPIESEDSVEINRLLKSDSSLKINLQEPKFGNTILALAVGNDKLVSTIALLENSADLNICDSFGFAPLHSASDNVNSRENSFQLIEALLKFGANPNKFSCQYQNKKIKKYFPLMGAIRNFKCSKLLIDNGANCNLQDSINYPIWQSILSQDDKVSESIFVAEYLIINKKVVIPEIIGYSIPDKNPILFIDVLKKYKTIDDSKKEEAKNRIIKYLKM